MTNAIIFHQTDLPIFQNKVYADKDSALQAECGNVELIQCPTSGLVHNQCFDSTRLVYDSNYQNEQAHSPAFKQHLKEVIGITNEHFSNQQHGVEIGCGKGYFFEMLLDSGMQVTGYDPTYEGSNPHIVKQYFDASQQGVSPDYILLRHVLEHITNPWDFLQRLSSQCGSKTKIYIEVPCFDWIINNNAFYDIFYEHVNYFTLEVLRNAFSSIAESGHFFGGQYIYIIADLSSFNRPRTYLGKIYQSTDMDTYLFHVLSKRRKNCKCCFVWGAGAKGLTFSNILIRCGTTVDAIIDINPAKQNKYSGKAGLPIRSAHSLYDQFNGSDIFIMNPQYFNEIRTTLNNFDVNLISVV